MLLIRVRRRTPGNRLMSTGKGLIVVFRGVKAVAIGAIVVLSAASGGSGREKLSDEDSRGPLRLSSQTPAIMLVAHTIGKIELAVANNGTFGREYVPSETRHAFTGESIPLSCQYPKGSNVAYLFGGAFWIGAVSGRDTLVSVGADGWQLVYEMFPDEPPFGNMQYRTIRDDEEGLAVSEEDYISVYTDTFPQLVDNDFFGRSHRPLNIEITQASYAWSYSYAEDFVLFDYRIKNIGTETLEQVYMGIYVDAMICYDCFGQRVGFDDDHSGFLHTYSNDYGACTFEDTVFVAWQADDDGDLGVVFADGREHPCPHAVATRIVRTPADTLEVSFNWWIGNGNPNLDFGPRERDRAGAWKEPFRPYGTGGLGTPEGDVNKYYVMRNREFDYDQIYTASITPNDTLWLYPNQNLADDFADGYDTRYLLSFGPFTISPGQSLPISFAYLGGENIHVLPNNAENLPGDPDAYYANLDFSDLALNAMWASWVYDNPGIDTDGDGYRGRYHLCSTTVKQPQPIVDTVWFEGDGIPDFRGASPPPAPDIYLDSPVAGTIRIRFNGRLSETTKDIFSNLTDFEGYRIYLARDNRAGSFSLVASYDIEDYNKYVWNPVREIWELNDPPFTLEELRCLYGASCADSTFEPLFHTRSRPLQYGDSVFYFEPQDYNQENLNLAGGIAKVYPDQEYPTSLDPDSAMPDELTPEGRLKYFEYEYVVEDLLPSVPYWVNVTAFDFGSPVSGLRSLETSVTTGAKMIYARVGGGLSGNDAGEIVVYPNPYRIDAGYRNRGYEGRSRPDRPDSRVRAIHFANVPSRCTIRIFTLDGDLVREIVHDEPESSGEAHHAQWDLITRNTQMVVSGLYYWTVEDESGNVRMGRLAIIT